jgi:hypothetical protein
MCGCYMQKKMAAVAKLMSVFCNLPLRTRHELNSCFTENTLHLVYKGSKLVLLGGREGNNRVL